MSGSAGLSSALTPPGLQAIYSSLKRIYPDQPNPLQVTALVKYWLNGPDPLDYVSMYSNPGIPEEGIPPHWHYISCGLSDLYGDGRVHDVTGDDGPSGFGFELTFRLRKDATDVHPPTWPAELMQSLARYVFQSENVLCSGDHVSWHVPLDFSNTFIQQMLMGEDPQLPQLTSPFGHAEFIQIVGVCTEELQAAQQWNGPAVLELLRATRETGGPWLITDMKRTKTMFQINPRLKDAVEDGIAKEGSNLSGVSAKCWWSECSADSLRRANTRLGNRQLMESESRPSSSTRTTRINSASNGREESENYEESLSRLSNYSAVSDLIHARPLNAIQLRFNLEAAMLLPLAMRGRLAHGRHFTFKSAITDSAITFVSTDVTGTSVDEKCPYAAYGTWLQILIPDDFLDLLFQDFEELSRPDEIQLPKEYAWPTRGLMITIVEDER